MSSMKKVVILLFVLLISCSHITRIYYDIDYARYNSAYKKVLYATGQGQPSEELMQNLTIEWNNLSTQYKYKSPYKDRLWVNDTDEINLTIEEANVLISEGKLAQAHEKLEQTRQVWKKIWTRNKDYNRHYWALAFHDIMEESVENLDNSYCPELMDYWLEIKRLNEDIKEKDDFYSLHMIEQSYINKFCDDPGEENSKNLKSGFVKFYLKYG